MDTEKFINRLEEIKLVIEKIGGIWKYDSENYIFSTVDDNGNCICIDINGYIGFVDSKANYTTCILKFPSKEGNITMKKDKKLPYLKLRDEVDIDEFINNTREWYYNEINNSIHYMSSDDELLIIEKETRRIRYDDPDGKMLNYMIDCGMITDKPFRLNIITMSGSMDFYDIMLKEGSRLELEGNVVILPFPISQLSEMGKKEYEKARETLRKCHECKIDKCDELYVVNKGGYIGKSTKLEIDYAKSVGKKITYMEPIN